MKKHKMTGCARLFIALIIIAPLAYLGASYYNGENGIENIKNLLGIGDKSSDNRDADTYQDTSIDLRQTISEKEARIHELEKEVERLKKENASLRESTPQEQE
jgi:cell division protein FtsB